MTSNLISKNLYDRDFNLWVLETINQLKKGDFQTVDIDHLVEELEGLSRRDKRELKSRLRVLIAHLLKRRYVSNSDYYRGWDLTIREQRRELENLLQQSPSLKSYFLDIFSEVCQEALIECQDSYLYTQFPNECPFTADIDSILSEIFWEE